VRRIHDAILAAGGSVLVITFEPPERIPFYVEAHGWPFAVVSDPTRAAYQAFGLGSAGWVTLFGPRVVLEYLGLMAKGYRPMGSDSDVHQLGGDFVIDADRRIVFAHRSNDPADRPAAEELLRALRSISSSRPCEG